MRAFAERDDLGEIAVEPDLQLPIRRCELALVLKVSSRSIALFDCVMREAARTFAAPDAFAVAGP